MIKYIFLIEIKKSEGMALFSLDVFELFEKMYNFQDLIFPNSVSFASLFIDIVII